jgi:hypothetical protein
MQKREVKVPNLNLIIRNINYIPNREVSGFYGGDYEVYIFLDVIPCSLVQIY